MQNDRLTELLKQYSSNTISPEGLEELFQSLETTPDPAALKEMILASADSQDRVASPDLIQWQKIWTNIDKNTTHRETRIHWLQRSIVRYAAALILLLGAGVYWFVNNKSERPPALAKAAEPRIPAGHNGAILTLADGSEVLLDSMPDGLVLNQQGTAIRLKEGQLTYDASHAGKGGFNTINTPRGRQFKLVMPDGTNVWLDAASSIRYPTVFSGKERRVEITGQAYLEVQKDPARPFIVNIDGNTSVKVLGTAFNVNSYKEEGNIKTTLVQGSVQITFMNGTALLKPGQQALADADKGLHVKKVDVTKETAWKNGLFQFTDADLKKIMREFGRWYNVDVVYEGDVEPRNFEGAIPRSLDLRDALDVLKGNNVHFKLEGRKLIVLP